MLLSHPQVALLPCDECRSWIREPDTWKVVKRAGKPQPNKTRVSPCHKCPKQSPEQAHEYELSERNQYAVQFYYEVRATSGACLSEREKQDETLRRNLSIIDGIVRGNENHDQARMIAATLFPAKVGR